MLEPFLLSPLCSILPRSLSVSGDLTDESMLPPTELDDGVSGELLVFALIFGLRLFPRSGTFVCIS